MFSDMRLKHLPQSRDASYDSAYLRGSEKVLRKRMPVTSLSGPPRPPWIKVKVGQEKKVTAMRALLRDNELHTVCEEARCPNLVECFSRSTATFMILGDKCTRRCSFCDVAHGRPSSVDAGEPTRLAATVKRLGLSYVVITSVDRDDLSEGGAGHFADCIGAIREACPKIRIEILVPDFRKRMSRALDALEQSSYSVFGHNIETVPRLYRTVRVGSDYMVSLRLLKEHKRRFPDIPTKTAIMLGLGETFDEVMEVMADLCRCRVDMLTIGQYLSPGPGYLPVCRYPAPSEFDRLKVAGVAMGFKYIASGPMVRSSYRADAQFKEYFNSSPD